MDYDEKDTVPRFEESYCVTVYRINKGIFKAKVDIVTEIQSSLGLLIL